MPIYESTSISTDTLSFGTGFTGGNTYYRRGAMNVAADSTNTDVVTVALGNHQSAVVKFVFAATDWCCHSGGTGIIECELHSGYSTPGIMRVEHIGNWSGGSGLDFHIRATSGYTRALSVNNGYVTYGTATMHCYALVQSSGGSVSFGF